MASMLSIYGPCLSVGAKFELPEEENSLRPTLMLLLAQSFVPLAKKKTAIALCVAIVADDCKAAVKGRLQCFAVAALGGPRQISLLIVLLPLVDGVRDGNAFLDFRCLGFTAQYTRHPAGTQPPFCI